MADLQVGAFCGAGILPALVFVTAGFSPASSSASANPGSHASWGKEIDISGLQQSPAGGG
ncbi:MAG: hypothetical protein DMG39_27995 [Acidobacteria bacterium]|nr:MAG: hypothetical protein DMG39_27995 [Acidobacteriota bacterium]